MKRFILCMLPVAAALALAACSSAGAGGSDGAGGDETPKQIEYVSTVLRPEDTSNPLFGDSVAIDGDTALVGAPGSTRQEHATEGSVVVYRRTDSGWTFEARLEAADGVAGDRFGDSVDMSGDYAIIGADGLGGRNNAAYIFRRTSGGWTQEKKLEVSGATDGDYFGRSVAIDGDRALVGAWGVDGGKGAVYPFQRVGSDWVRGDVLEASDGATSDLFGITVALDGDYAVIGAYGVDGLDGAGRGETVNHGAAYMFRLENGSWTEEQRLTSSDRDDGDRFGNAVALSDGYAVVVATRADGVAPDSGAAYIFRRDETGSNWVQETKIFASDGTDGGRFGAADPLDISGDYAVVGAWNANGDNEGALYVFRREDGGWQQHQTLKLEPPGNAADGYFGWSAAIDGDHIIAANPGIGSSVSFWENR